MVLLITLSVPASAQPEHLSEKCLDNYYKNGGTHSRRFPLLPPAEIEFLCKITGHDAEGVVKIMKRNSRNAIYEEHVSTSGNVTLRYYRQAGIVISVDDDIYYNRATIRFVNGLAVDVSLSKTSGGETGRRID